jgi:signal transduction histidine kinase
VLPVFFRAGGNLAALAELRRVAGLPLKVEVVPAESFQLRLSEAFNNPGMRAASMVGDIEESADLTRLLMIGLDSAAPLLIVLAGVAEALRRARRRAAELAAENRRWRALAMDRADRVAIVSHELRTPIALISGAAELLLDGQRAVPRRLLQAGFRFRFTTLEEALADLLAGTDKD